MNRLFLSSEALYERRGLYLDFSSIPLEPGRLLDIIPALQALRFNTIVVHWGGLYPWSFEERVQTPGAYPQQVISGFYRRLHTEGIEAYTRIPGPDYFGFILNLKSFAYLRANKEWIDELNVTAPGARQLVNDMIDDIVHVCSSTGFFIESDGLRRPEGDGVPSSDRRCERRDYYNSIIETVLQQDRGVIFQVPRDDTLHRYHSVDGCSFAAEKQDDATRPPSGPVDWTLIPLDCKTSGLTLTNRRVLVVDRNDDGLGASLVSNPHRRLASILETASYLWNGRAVKVQAAAGDYLKALFPGVESIITALEELEKALKDVYDISIRLKTVYSFFRSRAGDKDPGGRETDRIMRDGDNAVKRVRRCMLDCLAVSESFIPSGWMEDWCNLMIMPAFEDLAAAKLRLRLFLDIQSGV